MASVHPQYNLLNFGYQLFVQIFEKIEKQEYPPYIDEYMTKNGITMDRVISQQRLIADLLDGLLGYEYERDDSTTYLQAAMKQCHWADRFDWEARAVFDMLASQAVLASYFLTVADLFNETDVKAQNPGQLRKIIERFAERAMNVVNEATN